MNALSSSEQELQQRAAELDRVESAKRFRDHQQYLEELLRIDDAELAFLQTPLESLKNMSQADLIRLVTATRRQIYRSAIHSHETNGDYWDSWVPDWFESV